MKKCITKYLLCLCICLCAIGLAPKKSTQAACSHKWGSYVTTRSATCTSSGSKKRTCSKCGAAQTASIAALGHNYSAATCTSAKRCTRCGSTSGNSLGHNYAAATCTSAKKCTRCGSTSGNSLGHNWGSWVTEESATCTAAGAQHRVCSRCGRMEQSKINALGHNYSAATCTAAQKCKRCGATNGSALGHNYSAATCTAAKKCTRCGSTSGNALGHNWGSWTTDKAATCTVSGAKHRSCTRCGSTDSATIAALGHNYSTATCTAASKCSRCGATNGSALDHNWGSWVTEEAATCTAAGAKHRVCSRCNKMEQAKIPALGHNWGSYTVTQTVNCKQDGYETRYCRNTGCSASESRKYASKNSNHSWGNWVIEEAATCEYAGAKHRTCSVCKKTETAKIDATGHNWGEYKITQTVGCEVDGIKTRSCNNTGCTKKQSYVYQTATGHDWGKWVEEEPATCVLDGAQHRTCKNCSKMEQAKIPATGHNWSSYSITQEVGCENDGIKTRICNNTGCRESQSYVYQKKTGHTWGDWVIEEEATCIYDGSKHRVCATCKKMEQARIEAPGYHNWSEYEITQKVDCTHDGIKTRKCQNPNCLFAEQIVYQKKTGHHWRDWEYDSELSCTTPEIKHRFCNNCGEKLVQTTPALGHSYNSSKYCKNCKLFICDAEGHDYSGRIENGNNENHKVYCKNCESFIVEKHLFVKCYEYNEPNTFVSMANGEDVPPIESSHILICGLCDGYLIERCSAGSDGYCTMCGRDMRKSHVCTGTITYTDNNRIISTPGHTGHCQDPNCPGFVESHHFIVKTSSSVPDEYGAIYDPYDKLWKWVVCKECGSDDTWTDAEYQELCEHDEKLQALLGREAMYMFFCWKTACSSGTMSLGRAEVLYNEYCDENGIKRGTAEDLAARRYFGFEDPIFVDGFQVVNGMVDGKIPVEDYVRYRENSVHNISSDTMTLGKYDGGGPTGYIAMAGDTSYFDMGKEWNTVTDAYGLDSAGKQMFEYFNKPALDDAMRAGKTIRFSHNPTMYGDCALSWEWNYLQSQYGYSTLVQKGSYWYAVK